MLYTLDQQQRERVIWQTKGFIQQASSIFDKKIASIPIEFDLKGHTVGMYKAVGFKSTIRYNEAIFSKYFADNLANTVPHEVAHYVVDKIYGRRKTSPHGKEWAGLMRAFGVKPDRLARYDLSDIKKRNYQTRAYRCDCQEHALGIRRHNKVVKKTARYYCKHCSSLLKPC